MLGQPVDYSQVLVGENARSKLALEDLRAEEVTGRRFRMDRSIAEVVEAGRSDEPVAAGGWSG
ncbi:MAG: hypothetical protein JSS68_09315 [Actinobacteria bacterium]|nr:hypothetical protein [Actinomycetota bacterium]MBS1882934.1 hypothetical protein [Actinomycetota bacterium]